MRELVSGVLGCIAGLIACAGVVAFLVYADEPIGLGLLAGSVTAAAFLAALACLVDDVHKMRVAIEEREGVAP